MARPGGRAQVTPPVFTSMQLDVACWHSADVPIRRPDVCFQGGARISRGSRVDRRSSAQHRLDGKPARARSHTIGWTNEAPNHLLVNELSLSIQGIGGRCGR